MLTTSKTGIARFIENCVAQGMRHVVCSPGSRNAALIVAIDNHPDLETTIVVDERSAGFVAMGMAQQFKAPVGVVCTSGSAMLNYYPAVAEAYYQCIPLVVISADRPKEWVNHGDGQTIVQSGVYTNHIHAEVEVPEYVGENDTAAFDASIIDAFQAGNGDWKGPIHFNCPITEPMYETVERPQVDVPGLSEIEMARMTADEKNALEQTWNASSKRLILCGQMNPNPVLLNALIDLCEDSSVAVLVENTSNLVHQKFSHCIDRSLSSIPEEALEDFQPDLLISMGGAVVSKRIKAFLRNAPIQTHWRVGAAFPEMDTYRKLTHSTKVSPSVFARTLLDLERAMHPSSFGWKWKQMDFLNQERLGEFISTAPYSDLSVFDVVLDCIPDNAHLHMGNSSVVRYCQLFNPVKSIRYYANRGTSGIDGSLSTAVGASVAAPNNLHVAILGDLSFFYDSNAFWNNAVGENLKTIVINNGGGGIFRIIEGPERIAQLDRYFETENNGSVAGMCSAYNVAYLSAQTLEEVEKGMQDLLTGDFEGRPALLEVFTPNKENDPVLKGFFNYFKTR